MTPTPSRVSARLEDLEKRLRALRDRHPIRYCFIPSAETHFIRYFSEEYAIDFDVLNDKGFEHVAPGASGTV